MWRHRRKNLMKLLIVSFYFPPDLSAGSFRTKGLVDALLKYNTNIQIDVLTTYPHRYESYNPNVNQESNDKRLRVHRLNNKFYGNSLLGQILTFNSFRKKALNKIKEGDWDLVYATSSRLMTAYLGSVIALKKGIVLYLDIRDLFIDTVNDIFPKTILLIINPFLKYIEKKTFQSANKINLVSKGFNKDVLKIYNKANISNFTNGIDKIFLDTNFDDPDPSKKNFQILYVGNIGGGQALNKIIPKTASKTSENIIFKIIGDGNSKSLLKKEIQKYNLNNVQIDDPVDRTKLLDIYKESDALFLHLDDVEAFSKVLPSKLFEYAALNKPIIAGVQGYSKEFIENNISDAYIFDPCDHQKFIKIINKIKNKRFVIDRSKFCTKFSRSEIMKEMSIDIHNTFKNERR